MSAIDGVHHLAARHCFQLDVAVGQEFGVDGYQIIGPTPLDAMTGEVDQGPIGVIGLGRESLQRVDQTIAVEIVGDGDVEAIGFERTGVSDGHH
jgi:hypothetical protein